MFFVCVLFCLCVDELPPQLLDEIWHLWMILYLTLVAIRDEGGREGGKGGERCLLIVVRPWPGRGRKGGKAGEQKGRREGGKGRERGRGGGGRQGRRVKKEMVPSRVFLFVVFRPNCLENEDDCFLLFAALEKGQEGGKDNRAHLREKEEEEEDEGGAWFDAVASRV